MQPFFNNNSKQAPWNKGKLIGQKPPLKLQEIWAIRIRLQIDNRFRDLAMFNLAIDSKLRACDLLKLRVSDVSHNGRVSSRAMILQQKTRRAVQFEVTAQTRDAIGTWIRLAGLVAADFLFPSQLPTSLHLSRRQYARIVESWVTCIGLVSSVSNNLLSRISRVLTVTNPILVTTAATVKISGIQVLAYRTLVQWCKQTEVITVRISNGK